MVGPGPEVGSDILSCHARFRTYVRRFWAAPQVDVQPIQLPKGGSEIICRLLVQFPIKRSVTEYTLDKAVVSGPDQCR